MVCSIEVFLLKLCMVFSSLSEKQSIEGPQIRRICVVAESTNQLRLVPLSAYIKAASKY
jgi:hypothetical protein